MDPLTRQVLSTTGGKKSTYIDDVYKSSPYRGDGTATQTITTGLDIAGDGGLVWVKKRTDAGNPTLQDSLMSDNQYVVTSSANGTGTNTTRIKTITSTGFQVGDDGDTGSNNKDYASWNFKKNKGFFDVVEYTGNSSASQTISHGLGCLPGCFMLKSLSVNGDWRVWHRGIEPNTTQYGITLNGTGATYGTIDEFGSTDPTATHFTVGGNKNTDGVTYRCYLWAGGASTAATAKSVNFDGSSDYLRIPDSAAFDIETNWTAECWFNADGLPGSYNGIIGQWSGSGTNGWVIEYVGTELQFYYANSGSHKVIGKAYKVGKGQWHHVAISKEGSTTRIFLNGTQTVPDFDMGTISSSSDFTIGGHIAGSSGWFDGKISNVRVVKGTAVYTSGFRPSTEPLTNITNTVLLCCNDSSSSGSTVTPGTITANGSTVSTDSPFDDPEVFQFGEEGDQNIIKCGSYMGNGTGGTQGVEVNLGFQPQFLLVKCTASVGSDGTWGMFDDIRGIVSNNTDAVVMANNGNAEVQWMRMRLTSRGFTLTDSNPQINNANSTMIYIAIRGRDPLVSQPVEAGTDAFAMDVGSGSNRIPPGVFDTGFPVDFALMREPAASSQWYTTARLQGYGYVRTNDNTAEAQGNPSFYKGSNVGWGQDSYGANWMSWAWKKCAGFDTVAYVGRGVAGMCIPHNLTKTPEMIWIKSRGTTDNWAVGHIGLNGGTNPWQYGIQLNGASSNSADSWRWNNTPPTSTHFTIGAAGPVNDNAGQYIAYLFASVAGISKCGYYTGSGSSAKVISDVGFTPRFLIIKCATDSWGWAVFDSTRGLTNSGNDPVLYLNTTPAQSSSENYITDVSATGFTIAANYNLLNQNNEKYIYYAHA